MALPLVFSMVISLVYNMVDTFFIARTGNTNLVAGVSLGAPMFTAMIALGDIFGLGGSSVIARLFGQRKDEDAKRISSFCFYGAIICGVIVTVLLLIFRAPMLHLLGADANTYKYASQYYTYLVLGSVFIIVSFTPNNQLRSEGFSKASMEGSVLGAVVNIILDPIFISVLGIGAGGAAIATIIGYIATDAYYVWIYLKKSKSCRLIRDICILTCKNSDRSWQSEFLHRSRTLCRALQLLLQTGVCLYMETIKLRRWES